VIGITQLTKFYFRNFCFYFEQALAAFPLGEAKKQALGFSGL
jgi:hypothetical protein